MVYTSHPEKNKQPEVNMAYEPHLPLLLGVAVD